MSEIERMIEQSSPEREDLEQMKGNLHQKEGLDQDKEHKKQKEEKKVDKPLAKSQKVKYNIIIKKVKENTVDVFI